MMKFHSVLLVVLVLSSQAFAQSAREPSRTCVDVFSGIGSWNRSAQRWIREGYNPEDIHRITPFVRSGRLSPFDAKAIVKQGLEARLENHGPLRPLWYPFGPIIDGNQPLGEREHIRTLATYGRKRKRNSVYAQEFAFNPDSDDHTMVLVLRDTRNGKKLATIHYNLLGYRVLEISYAQVYNSELTQRYDELLILEAMRRYPNVTEFRIQLLDEFEQAFNQALSEGKTEVEASLRTPGAPLAKLGFTDIAMMPRKVRSWIEYDIVGTKPK